MGGLEQKLRGGWGGETGEMESVRNERMRRRGEKKKGGKMEMNGGEREQEAAAALTASEIEPRPRDCQPLEGLDMKKKCS